MAYTSWDETAPADVTAAKLLGDDIRTGVKVCIRERMNDLLGITDWATQVSPMRGQTLRLDRGNNSGIVAGITRLDIFANDGVTSNLGIVDNGSITLRNTLTISAGGITITSGGATITAGGISLNGGALTVANTASTSTFNSQVDITNAQARTTAYSIGNSGATKTINWNNGNVQYVTLTASCTFTLSNPLEGSIYTLLLIQDGTGSRLITWPTIKWVGGITPILTTTASKADLISLLYTNGSYYGLQAGSSF